MKAKPYDKAAQDRVGRQIKRDLTRAEKLARPLVMHMINKVGVQRLDIPVQMATIMVGPDTYDVQVVYRRHQLRDPSSGWCSLGFGGVGGHR